MSDEDGPGRSLLQDRHELRRRRILAGLNQEDLAGKTGLDRSHISLLERGGRSTTPKTLARLADALGCEVADLVADKSGRGDAA